MVESAGDLRENGVPLLGGGGLWRCFPPRGHSGSGCMTMAGPHV